MNRKPTRYKAYSFQEYDPAIREVLTALNGQKATMVEQAGGPKAATIRAWRKRKTRRPQHCTLAAALGSQGLVFTIGKAK